MKDRIYKDLILVLKMCFIIFAFLGIFYTFFYEPIEYSDIRLIGVNGNTGTEYVIEVDGEQYIYHDDYRTYYSHNTNYEGRMKPDDSL